LFHFQPKSPVSPYCSRRIQAPQTSWRQCAASASGITLPWKAV
jgi:hypothetical protein